MNNERTHEERGKSFCVRLHSVIRLEDMMSGVRAGEKAGFLSTQGARYIKETIIIPPVSGP